MSVRDSPNLRRWVGWVLRRPESKVIEESFELVPKTVSGDTTMNGQRKGGPNSWGGEGQQRSCENRNMCRQGTNNNLESDERKVRDGV